ncbi:porin [Burkholderia sp. Bp9017]|uniref:porin n=1 Tax=Burkholderia TaxID=32008 RepID=UPI000F5E180C|nr:porin [Burkholderia sp. Bp9017]RQZ31710.1 porin [Burkholderia sp. Bp9017]RQZ37841.1 porin [Burkholderia sp. Bp9016]VWB18817.1 porin [Burkholderia lata]
MKSKMKRSLLCCAALALPASASHAQSTVTLYGVIDEGLMYLSNTGGASGGKKIYLESLSGLMGSRWGLTGKEDLGGGWRAIFTLESGVNLNNGTAAQGGAQFGRQAFVGIAGDQFGTLTFGRQYDIIFYIPAPLTGSNLLGGDYATHPGDIDNAGNGLRVNNAIRFMSRDYSGFTFGGEYSVGGIAGNVTSNSGYSVGAAYATGPLKVAAAFEYFKTPTSATPGSGFFTGNANGATTLSQSLNSGYTGAQAYQVAMVSANYAISALTLAASFSNVQYAHLGAAYANGTARFNSYDVGARYQFSPALFMGVAYDYVIGAGVSKAAGGTVGNQHYHQVSFLADYFLSKRTDVYLGVGWQRASGTSSLGTRAVADIDSLGDSSNNHQILARLALRHKF